MKLLFKGIRKDNNEEIEGFPSKQMLLSEEALYDYYTIDDIEIIPNSLKQFTGLIDKNKNKIFNKDILLFKNYKSQVIFEDGAYFFAHNKIRLHQSIANFTEIFKQEILL